MSDQKVSLLLLRSKPIGGAQKIAEISSGLKQAKQAEFKEIILTYSSELNVLYGYFYFESPLENARIDTHTFLGETASLLAEIELSRIMFANPIKGFSSDQVPHNRYVVEMDPEVGWEEELFSWYDQEHLPGLASVPGCVSATRCLNLDHAPYSFSFYDLISPEVLGCEPWLKVRHTPWSDRVRPHFTNTRRAMFQFL
jgi:hypothetical protein